MAADATFAPRVVPTSPYESLDAYIAAGGGEGVRAARAVEASVVVDELDASGLRGRGGAGFPTGTKWRTVLSFASDVLATTVVVNAAEGEPGTYKDRTILLANPYAVLEGALIAARVVGARSIIVATKARFGDVVERVQRAIAELERAQWLGDVSIEIVQGPAEYLFGEETALVEVIDGRPPFPRIAPPWRRGVVEVVADEGAAESGSGQPAEVELGSSAGGNEVPPVLVDNVETLANIPAIIARGAAWFRECGTEASAGSIVCTVTGASQRSGVAEVPLGTTLRAVIEQVGGGARAGRQITGVLTGVSNAIVPAAHLDVPLTYEALAEIGSGLGSASFIVLDDLDHPVSVAAGVSRFLAVESCGQCTACKVDGVEISARLDDIRGGAARSDDLPTVLELLDRIPNGARCNLAQQHQTVVGSIIETWSEAFAVQSASGIAQDRYPIAELMRIDAGMPTIDDDALRKQPDWSYDEVDSGTWPAERLVEHRAAEPPLDR